MPSTTSSMARKHLMQRLHSPSRGLSAVLHTVGVLSFAGSFNLVDYPTFVNDSYGWHFQYLTVIGLAMAMATTTLGLLADVFLSPQLFRAKNVVSTATAPLDVLVSLLYWGICSIDKKLVIPEWVQLSPLADVGFHAMPAIVLVTDLIFFSPPWEILVLPALGLSGGLAFSYWLWIEHCYEHNGWYPYPLFTALNPGQRAVLFATSALLMALSTVMLKRLYQHVNRTQSGSVRAGRGAAAKQAQ